MNDDASSADPNIEPYQCLEDGYYQQPVDTSSISRAVGYQLSNAITIYTNLFAVDFSMSPTVLELQNAIRTAVGRFEREVSASFTKEELVAIANEVGYAVDEGSRPSTTMRAGIRWKTGLSESKEAASGKSFIKDELQAIANELGVQAE